MLWLLTGESGGSEVTPDKLGPAAALMDVDVSISRPPRRSRRVGEIDAPTAGGGRDPVM